MKKLMMVILLCVGLVAVVAGCGGAHRYDAQLVAADGLMQTDPDSALALVEAVPEGELTSEGDRAYRALLLTQARYKTYQDILASDDSAITRAMAWYRAHSGEREKLTRAYLYKGAVMQELGHVDSAMYYYKTAEVTADTKDYTNLGQINIRIADIYRYYYADPQICYDKYNQALTFHKFTRNKQLQLACLLYMASCSGIMHKDDAEQLLYQATELALELNDSLCYYLCQELLCRQLSFDGKSISRAKQIAMHCLNDYRGYINHDLLLDLADIYAYSGMPDSARYYLEMVTENAGTNNLEQVKTRKYLILSDISRLEGDTALSSHYDMLSHQVSDSISNNKLKYQIQEIENSFNNRQHTGFLSQISRLQWAMSGIIALTILVLLLFAIYHYRRVSYIKSLAQELQHARINRHDQLLEQLDSHNHVIGQFVKNMVTFMQTLMDASEKDGPTTLRQRVKDGLGSITTSEDFWDALRAHVDLTHDGLISRIAKNPSITTKDQMFIELCCCGFDYLEISIIMGYTPRYVLNKRKIIAKKMGLQIPLMDYLNDQKMEKGQ